MLYNLWFKNIHRVEFKAVFFLNSKRDFLTRKTKIQPQFFSEFSKNIKKTTQDKETQHGRHASNVYLLILSPVVDKHDWTVTSRVGGTTKQQSYPFSTPEASEGWMVDKTRVFPRRNWYRCWVDCIFRDEFMGKFIFFHSSKVWKLDWKYFIIIFEKRHFF